MGQRTANAPPPMAAGGAGADFSAISQGIPSGTPGPMGAFDEGGSVPDDGGDLNAAANSYINPNPPTQDPNEALGVVMDTLDFGRQQAGLGGQDSGVPTGGDYSQMRPSTNVEDHTEDSAVGSSDLPQPKGSAFSAQEGSTSAAMNSPQMLQTQQPQVGLGRAKVQATPIIPDQPPGYAQGGAIPDDEEDNGNVAPPPTPQPSMPGAAPQGGGGPMAGAPPKLVGYVSGQGGVTPDVLAAMEQKVDPHGVMDPSMRTMLTIAQQGSPQQRWAAMQAYRQRFNAYQGIAKAAAMGTPSKPADMGAAAKYATLAYQNVPDGNSVSFTPSEGGVTAHVHRVGKTKRFDDGGPVDDSGDYNSGLQDMSGVGAVPTQMPVPSDVDWDNLNKIREARPTQDNVKPDDTQTPGKVVDNVKPDDTQTPGKVVDNGNGTVTAKISQPAFAQWLNSPQQHFDGVMQHDMAMTLPKGGLMTGFGQVGSSQPEDQPENEDIAVLPDNPTKQQIADFNQKGARARAMAQKYPAQQEDFEDKTVRDQAKELYRPGSPEYNAYIEKAAAAQSAQQNKLDITETAVQGRQVNQAARLKNQSDMLNQRLSSTERIAAANRDAKSGNALGGEFVKAYATEINNGASQDQAVSRATEAVQKARALAAQQNAAGTQGNPQQQTYQTATQGMVKQPNQIYTIPGKGNFRWTGTGWQGPIQ
jgi:hypothetical protein